MSILGKTNLEISRIGLGTVEIGLADYGVDQKGLISEADAITLLKSAVGRGVTYIDTARGYGVAEERIGKSGIAKQPSVVIGTKCAQFLEKGEDPHGAELEKRIRDDVETSLHALRTDSLQLLQLHGGSAEQIQRGELIEIMQKLKDEGKVQHVGIATRGEDAPLAAIASDFFETIQVAHSIVDQRMTPNVFPQAQAANVGIINRSVLLKGALTPAATALPPELEPLKKASQTATAIAENLGIDLPTLAIRFALSQNPVSVALLGTTKISRLEHALAAKNAGSLPSDVLTELGTLAIDDTSQVDPSQWPQL